MLWRTLVVLCVVLGSIGVFLPGLPTVPFLLVAAWAGSRGWPAVETWLLDHPSHGAAIQRWRDRRAVPRRAKWLASLSMGISAPLIVLPASPALLEVGMLLLMASVAWWLWRRPEL